MESKATRYLGCEHPISTFLKKVGRIIHRRCIKCGDKFTVKE